MDEFKSTISFIICSLIVYVLFGIWNANMNIFSWHDSVRQGFVIVEVILLISAANS